MFKKITMSMMLLTALLLAACSESQSDKQVVVDAFETMMEAESYDATSTLDVNVEADVQDPFIEPYIQMVNDMELSMDQRMNQDKQEVVIHFQGQMSPMTFNVDIPFLQDMNENKMYVKTDSLIENFGMFLGLPEEAKGKLIEIDMAELEGQEAPEVDYDELTQQVQTIMSDFLNDKSEDDFRKEDDTYIVSFNKEDLTTLVTEMASELDDTITDEDIQMAQEEMTTALEQVDFNTFEVHTTLDGDNIKSQKVVLDLGIDAEGTQVQLDLEADTTYNSMNEDVEFEIDPENSDIIDMQEFDQLMMEALQQPQ
ncbi:hypothetical protein [Tenuibacillus multivorans]|uniref:Lipoprotein n=1 Tax=Tenuibacillus multivorans TaxID=237069 RepID=A0A1H0ALN3_9BACI|nr:hypothetical protein [Tenuibacillus multivorans]GEL78195.1 hypothetical protein TMU01_24300 [Tenuibacillus multivorans]SDN34325.1 hypothetical protein SAMN05216498_1988 [Tenuibacillus multivorans]